MGLFLDMERMTERFLLVEAIVSEALGVPDEARADLIEARCGEDSALAAEVHLLLDACEAEERMMESCRSESQITPENQPARKPVGPYEIDRPLGRGGMGAVYLAHRADGQFEQKVAIKLIDRPLETGLFQERFRRERQILASLQHPYIARLLDGGVTADDDLFLVMEYVDGLPIHRFCQERQLSQTQRIDLFLRVCEAVQFAHQNFIVHRDLKPDNILVAEDGTPRLLDFGTAKLLSPSMAGQDSQFTRDGYLSFTPQYASPEQVLGNPITTASDTYSLGVLLYLLLTGTPPYELKDLTMGQMLKTVCEEAPRRPSVAGGGKRIDTDLEAILLKALRKEPQERYLTAERLGDDLRAYLEGLPVAARHGTFRYRASKFIRRHRWGLAAAAVLVVTLIAGVAAVLWQARVANRERRIADEERRRAEARSADLRQLSNSLLTELDDAIQQIPGSTGAQKLLVTSVLQHLDRMAQDAQGDRQTQLDLAKAYTQLAELQGEANFQSLGDSDAALVSIDKAIALSTPWAGSKSKDREALHALANAQSSRGAIQLDASTLEQSRASTQEAISTYERLLELPGGTAIEMYDAAKAYAMQGYEIEASDPSGALSAYRRYIDLNSRALKIDPNMASAKECLIFGQGMLIGTESRTDPAQALKDIQIAFERIADLPKAEQENAQMLIERDDLLLFEVDALSEYGRYSEASAVGVKQVQSLQRQVSADPLNITTLIGLHGGVGQLGDSYEIAADPDLGASPSDRMRNLAAAEKLWSQDIDVLDKILKRDPSRYTLGTDLAGALVHLGSIQTILHNGQNSAELVKKGLGIYPDMIEKNQDSAIILDNAAQDYLFAEPATLKDPQLALSYSERAVASSHRKKPDQLLTLARAYRATGQIEKSRATAKEALALLPPVKPGDVKSRIRKLLEIQANSRF
ncbi:MAG: protein kinase domain-containing protein [Terracidiphilus sp.]